MLAHSENIEKQCEEYLEYLYRLVEKIYSDCTDVDSLVQDTLTALLLKINNGEEVEHPKGFLSAVLKNKYNAYLRQKYKVETVEYSDGAVSETYDELREREEAEQKNEEYEAVRREIGRLINIYREVTVRHYVHGQTVDQISRELGIPRGTVLSRLSSAREQIKEGVEKMEKYSDISYEPKSAYIGIWGSTGMSGEPLSLLRSDIEANILWLAYENPVSVRGIADTMGMPSAYIEQIIEFLIKGELMGRTSGGLVYTRCFVQRYDEAFGNIYEQERLAERYAGRVWEIAWKHIEPLTKHDEFDKMSDKQKGTMILSILNRILSSVTSRCKPKNENEIKQPPTRSNGGRWLATLTVLDHGQRNDSIYHRSGPVQVSYSKNNDGKFLCRMFDCQSVFGDAHWAYGKLKYRASLQSILRFYASFLPCNVKTDNSLLYELIPDFESLSILGRGEKGETVLDIPALTFDELTEYWDPAFNKITDELFELLSEDIIRLWYSGKKRVPKHVDGAGNFIYEGALGAYEIAQLLRIVNEGLLPYAVEIGKTPLIYIAYKNKDM